MRPPTCGFSREHLTEVALRFIQPILVQRVLPRLKKLCRDPRLPLQMRLQARHFAAFGDCPAEEVCADIAAAAPASNSPATTLNRMCALDTRLTLCCSVRQPPH